MLKKLKNIYRDEFFHPTPLSIFVNPAYFARKGLLHGVKEYSHYMKGVMLDFGCGHKPYERYFKVDKYIGLDIEESGHNHNNSREDSQIDVFYDGKTIPFDNEYFDSVFTSQVLEHVFNIEDILIEINRVMKPKGVIILTLPFVWPEHEIPYDFARYTSFGIKHLLNKNGFKIISQKKSTTAVAMIVQTWNDFLINSVFPSKPKLLAIILKYAIIPPFTIIGIILSKILPDNNSFYHSNIVVAEKI